MTNSLPWNRWPIEIDGLSIEHGWIFHGYVSHNQMVDINKDDLIGGLEHEFCDFPFHIYIWIIILPN